MSDTNVQHEELGVLRGDVLIHCGESGFGFANLHQCIMVNSQYQLVRRPHEIDIEAAPNWSGPVRTNP